ncbi:hypothetical protein LJZ89_RS26795, partial [Escherichia coli]
STVIFDTLADSRNNGFNLMMNDGKQQSTFLFSRLRATPLRTAMNKCFMICDFSLVRNLVHNTIFTSVGSHQTHHNEHR